MCIKKEFNLNNNQEFNQDNNRIYAIYVILMNDSYRSDVYVAYVNSKEDAKETVEQYNKLLSEYKQKYIKLDNKNNEIVQEQLSDEFNKENKLSFIMYNIKDLKHTYKFGYEPLPKAEGRYKWW